MSIINDLKKNKRPFGLMSEEIQEKVKVMGRHDFQCYMLHGQWLKCTMQDFGDDEFVSGTTYRLRPDYAEEPEIEECEIFTHDLEKKLMFERGTEVNYTLSYAPSFPDFIGFKFEDGKIRPLSVMYGKFGDVYYVATERHLSNYEILHATHVLFRRQK